MQGKVNLTWDETDPEREAAMKRAFDLADNDDDINAYLAVSSNDEEKLDSDQESFKQSGEMPSDGDGDMEMDFRVKDAEDGDKSKNQSPKDEESNSLAPWDRYLQKKKDKQKMKREARKMARKANNENDESDERIPKKTKASKEKRYRKQGI